MSPLLPILFNTSALMALCAIHFYWFFGGKAGIKYAFPKSSEHKRKSKRPSRIKLFLTFTLLLAMLILSLSLTDLLPANLGGQVLTPEVKIWGNRITGVLFLMRALGDFRYYGFTKTYTDSLFATLDYFIYSPISVLIAIFAFIGASYI